jgi:tetratricopeptide (TPR) repeat protein
MMKFKRLLIWIINVGFLTGITVQNPVFADILSRMDNLQLEVNADIRSRMDNLQLEVKNNKELAKTFICSYYSDSFVLYRVDRKIVHHYLRGEYQQALSLAKDTLASRMKHLGTEAPETICAMRTLGVIYLALDHLDEALLLCEKAYHLVYDKVAKPAFEKGYGFFVPQPEDILLEIYKRKVGSIDKFLDLFTIKSEWGFYSSKTTPYNFIKTYEMSGRKNEALLLLVKAYRLWKEILGQRHYYTLHAIRQIWKTVPTSNLPQFEQASRLRQEVLDLEKGNPDIYSKRQEIFSQYLSFLSDSESIDLDFEQEPTQPQHKLLFLYEKLQSAEKLESVFNFVLFDLAGFYLEMGNAEMASLILKKITGFAHFKIDPSESERFSHLLSQMMGYLNDFRNEALGKQHLNSLIKLDSSVKFGGVLPDFWEVRFLNKMEKEISKECLREHRLYDCFKDDENFLKTKQTNGLHIMFD